MIAAVQRQTDITNQKYIFHVYVPSRDIIYPVFSTYRFKSVECVPSGFRNKYFVLFFECHLTARHSVNMAPVSKKRSVSSVKTNHQSVKKVKVDLNIKAEAVLQSKKRANDVFDILEALEVNVHT